MKTTMQTMVILAAMVAGVAHADGAARFEATKKKLLEQLRIDGAA